MAVCGLLLMLCTPFGTAIPLSSFYSYGSAVGDAELPLSDDGSSSAVPLPTPPFLFFGIPYTSIYVNNNGDLTFNAAYSNYTPQPFPIQGNPMIAPFFADVDTRGTGKVWYRTTNDSALLAKAVKDIQSSLEGSDFTPLWLFIATWDHVGYYNNHTDKTNTFQCILTTDNVRSFVIFQYADGLIQWTTGDMTGGVGGLGGTPAQVGFNAGDSVNYANIQGSRTPAIINITSTSNVLVPGQWILSVQNAVITTTTVTSSPLNFTLSPVPHSPYQLSAMWFAPSVKYGNITAYTVYCNTSATQAYPEQVIEPNIPTIRSVFNGTTLSTILTGLIPFTQYECYVTANTSVGEGAPSQVVNSTTSETVPSAPLNIFLASVPGSPNQLLASWAPPIPKNGIVTAYTVYCNTSATQAYPEQVIGPNIPTIRSVVNGTTLTTIFNTGLIPYTQYECYVTANTSVGEGLPSLIVTNRTSKSGGCRGVYDTMWGLQWPDTAFNSTRFLPCPQGGGAYRFCSSKGDWGLADVTQCESSTITNLAQQILSANVAQALGIVNSLFDVTKPTHMSMFPLDLRHSVDIISTILTLLSKNLQQGGGTGVVNTAIILDVINNLLNESNLAGWQSPNAASTFFLMTCESYGLYLATIATSTITLSRSSIVLQASRVQIASNQADMKFPDGNYDLFINATFSVSDASIIIPGALLLERGNNASSVPVVNMIINNIGTFLPLNRSLIQQVDSLILSSQVAVEDGGFGSLALQKRPAMITFSINSRSNLTTQYKCSFWNFSSSSWSSEGMLPPSSNGSFVQCYSAHLTSFAVLLAVEAFPDSEVLTYISYIGCSISMACLLVTIVFLLSQKKQLLEKPHNFIHLNLAIALFLAFLIFVAGIDSAKNNIAACKAVAALLQYFWLSAFCWMMCEGVMLYLMVVLVFSTLKDKWWFFFILGWVPALIFVVIGLAVRSDYYVMRSEKDKEAISYCWISTEKGTIWAFAAPLVLIQLVNILFLLIVLVVLFKKGRAKSADVKMKKDNKTVVVSLIKATIILLPILGCTWIFGLLSISHYTLVFTWLFTILNSLQGFFIFIFYVFRHEKVLGRIRKKYEAWSSSIHSDHNKHKYSASSVLECKTIADTHITGIASPNYPTECNVYSDLKISEAIILESAESNEYSEPEISAESKENCSQIPLSDTITFQDCEYTLFSTTDISRDKPKSVHLQYMNICKDGEEN